MILVSITSCIGSVFTGDVGEEKFAGPEPVNLFLRGGLGKVLDTLDALSSAPNRRLRSSIVVQGRESSPTEVAERKCLSACRHTKFMTKINDQKWLDQQASSRIALNISTAEECIYKYMYHSEKDIREQ